MGKVVFINSESLGRGDDELGAKLTPMLLYSLGETDPKPQAIVLMNSGVRLACEGSPAVEHLQTLVEAGVKVHACGTCLDFFGLNEQLAVGEVGNMALTAELFLANDVVTI